MTLSNAIHNLLQAYDSFTDFAGGPDLPWVVEAYDELDDNTVQIMIRSLCYAWAAGQRAAGCYDGFVERLAQDLFEALPTWDGAQAPEQKVDWLRRIGVQHVLPEPEARPATDAHDDLYHAVWAGLTDAEREAITDMAAFFQIALPEATLMYHLGRALGRAGNNTPG
jgi:hypothetical protein